MGVTLAAMTCAGSPVTLRRFKRVTRLVETRGGVMISRCHRHGSPFVADSSVQRMRSVVH